MPKARADPDVARVINAGLQMHPNTTIFVKWLSMTAATTAMRLQMMAYLRTKGVGNSMESWGSKIKGVGDRLYNALSTILKFASDKGLTALDEMVDNFKNKATEELLQVVNSIGENSESASFVVQPTNASISGVW